MVLLDEVLKCEVQSVSAEDPPTHHNAAQPVPAETGNGQGLAFIIPVYPSFILISRKWRCLHLKLKD